MTRRPARSYDEDAGPSPGLALLPATGGAARSRRHGADSMTMYLEGAGWWTACPSCVSGAGRHAGPAGIPPLTVDPPAPTLTLAVEWAAGNRPAW